MYTQLERYRQKNNGRVRIVKYCRVSSDEQSKNGYSVQDQSNFIDLFAKENDLIIVDEYVDEGISATLEISKRKALAQLIEDAKVGKFDVVVIKCLDRFFRNVGEYYAAQKQLQKAGVTWLSIEEPDLDPADADSSFKINIYLSMSEFEARKAAMRVRFNNKMRIKNKQVITGNHNFFFPWKVVGEKKDKHLERDMEQAERLYDLLDHFEMFQSKRATLEYINDKYPPMTYLGLTKLLKDTLLYGEYRGVPDYVEPYITKERFDRIQEALSRNATQHIQSGRVYLFSGLIKCHCCGTNLVGASKPHSGGRNETLYYRCNYYLREKTCTNGHSISERKIEKQLLDNLEQYVQGEALRVASIEEKKKPKVDNTKKIESLKKEMARLNMMFRKGNIEEDEYDKETAIIKRSIKELEGAMEEEEERDLTALKKLIESDYRTIYNALDRPHKKAFWRTIIKEFTLTEQRKIDPKSIIFF